MASRRPRLYWAPICPASAARVHQMRASASSGGSSRPASSIPRPYWAPTCPASAARVHQVRASARLRRVQPVASSTPSAYCAPACPLSAARVHQVGLWQGLAGRAGLRAAPRGRTARRCARLRRPGSTRCGPPPAPAGPAGPRAAPRGHTARRCAPPRRRGGSLPARLVYCRAGRKRRQHATRPRLLPGPGSTARWFRSPAGRLAALAVIGGDQVVERFVSMGPAG